MLVGDSIAVGEAAGGGGGGGGVVKAGMRETGTACKCEYKQKGDFATGIMIRRDTIEDTAGDGRRQAALSGVSMSARTSNRK
jgi:hypothetical protein